jgi:hypothetical protein
MVLTKNQKVKLQIPHQDFANLLWLNSPGSAKWGLQFMQTALREHTVKGYSYVVILIDVPPFLRGWRLRIGMLLRLVDWGTEMRCFLIGMLGKGEAEEGLCEVRSS